MGPAEARDAAIAAALAAGGTRRQAALAAGVSLSTLHRCLRATTVPRLVEALQVAALRRLTARLTSAADEALDVLQAELRKDAPDPASVGRIKAAQATINTLIDARERLEPSHPSAA